MTVLGYLSCLLHLFCWSKKKLKVCLTWWTVIPRRLWFWKWVDFLKYIFYFYEGQLKIWFKRLWFTQEWKINVTVVFLFEKLQALEKYKYEQSLEHTSQFIEKLGKELEEYHKHLARFKKVNENATQDSLINTWMVRYFSSAPHATRSLVNVGFDAWFLVLFFIFIKENTIQSDLESQRFPGESIILFTASKAWVWASEPLYITILPPYNTPQAFSYTIIPPIISDQIPRQDESLFEASLDAKSQKLWS